MTKKDQMNQIISKENAILVLVGLIGIIAIFNVFTSFNLMQKIGSIETDINAISNNPNDTLANNSNNALDNSNDGVKEVKSDSPQLAPENLIPSPSFTVSADDDAVLGLINAPVEIIEFSDFECPFCQSFYLNTYQKIKEEYIDTGKAKLIYRDFPLSFHSNAQKAAEAAECAEDEGKFYEMHDKIFENAKSLSTKNFKKFASEIGLNTKNFDSCLDSGKYAKEVKKDFLDGDKYRVAGTPTFFINGNKVVGAQPFEVFKQIIDSELAGGN